MVKRVRIHGTQYSVPFVSTGWKRVPVVNPKFEHSDVKFYKSVASQQTKRHGGHLAAVGGDGAKDLRRRRMDVTGAV